MPRPPMLPTIEWNNIFEQGKDWAAWLDAAEMPEHRDKMRAIYDAVPLEPHETAMLRGLGKPVHVIAIAEDWCGDVVRHAPVLAKIAALSEGNVRLRFIPRELSLDLFARFLTNGGEAIPKFVFLSDQWVECGNWGPMPALCREWLSRGKAAGNVAAARAQVSAFYAADVNYRATACELIELIEIAATEKI